MQKGEEKACVSPLICHNIVMTIKEYITRKSFQPKTFSDLVFNAHANVNNGVQAKLDLGNGLEISVVSMKKREGEYGGLYGDVTEGTYEVAVFRDNEMLPLNATDDVRGWQTEDELTELMANLQKKSYQAFIANLYISRDEWNKEIA